MQDNFFEFAHEQVPQERSLTAFFGILESSGTQ
jgi:hypothetical protein